MADERQNYVTKIIDAIQNMAETTDHDAIMSHLDLAGLHIDHLMDAQIDYAKKNKPAYEKPQDPTDIKSVLTAMLTAATTACKTHHIRGRIKTNRKIAITAGDFNTKPPAVTYFIMLLPVIGKE